MYKKGKVFILSLFRISKMFSDAEDEGSESFIYLVCKNEIWTICLNSYGKILSINLKAVSDANLIFDYAYQRNYGIWTCEYTKELKVW